VRNTFNLRYAYHKQTESKTKGKKHQKQKGKGGKRELSDHFDSAMAAFEAANHREVLNARYGCRSSPEDGQIDRHLAVGETAGLARTQEHQR
jgi:hypothetical protein